MPASTIIQRTDIGVQFIVQIVDEFAGSIIDLSSATNVRFIFRRPNRSLLITSGSKLTDGTDGKVYYISTVDDLLLSGMWHIQVSYNLGTNYKLTNIENFILSDNLEDV